MEIKSEPFYSMCSALQRMVDNSKRKDSYQSSQVHSASGSTTALKVVKKLIPFSLLNTASVFSNIFHKSFKT